MRVAIASLVLGLALVALVPSAAAKDKDKDKLVVTPGEKEGDVEVLNCAPKGRALFLAAPGAEAGKKTGLLVTLHGHGGKPDGYVFRDFAARRKWAVVSVQGRTEVQGAGFSWDMTDAAYIDAVAKWCVENRGIDPAQVVVFGHSAGGTMSLAAQAAEPSLFAGVITCASPTTPSKAQETARVAVFLGTDDPNFANAKEIQNSLKKEANHLSLHVVEGAGHNETPNAVYLDLAVSWILAKNAVGHEVRVPKSPPQVPDPFARVVLLQWKGAPGAPEGLKRSKEAAKSLADDLLKRCKAGKALLSHEAQFLSDHSDSRPIGGAVPREGGMEGMGAIPTSTVGFLGPVETSAGFVVADMGP